MVYLFLVSCNNPSMHYQLPPEKSVGHDTLPATVPDSAGLHTNIETGATSPTALIAYARTLTGIPYAEGSAEPARGFDCSGFITYVFNHFRIAVPRSSVDFTHVGTQVTITQAKPGDLILFTGTDSTIRVVGHMGIIVSPLGAPVTFIHSTSGKRKGVTETPLNHYYMGRFVKIVRIFPQANKTQSVRPAVI
ncbi:C40 family peptidase [Mucilaginibacter hurinus]|nr:NlpC/P60 family protein [Mucilaginibacter hurinus]